MRNVATDGDGTTYSSTKANLQLIPLFDKSDLVISPITWATIWWLPSRYVAHL